MIGSERKNIDRVRRRWLVTAVTFDDEEVQITSRPLVGTGAEAEQQAEALANKWEARHGGLIASIQLCSIGVARWPLAYS